MAIIYTYPEVKLPLKLNDEDLFVLSKMDIASIPTKSVKLKDLKNVRRF